MLKHLLKWTGWGSDDGHVCPWWLCYTFDNPLRRLLHNPAAILGRFVQPGSHVIDIGPGMGYFSIPMAQLVGPSGQVLAIDLQEKMLSALMRRAQTHKVAQQVTTHVATPDSLGSHPQSDFALAFWMVHEVPDQKAFLAQVGQLLKPHGRLLLVEPRLHVPAAAFDATVSLAESVGFVVTERPPIRLSQAVLLEFGGNR